MTVDNILHHVIGTPVKEMRAKARIAVVIPCYRVRDKVLGVLRAIGPEVFAIYVIDDKCPEGTGRYVATYCQDQRVHIIENLSNLGVGGAVMVGYQRAIDDDMDCILKIDGDGQMNPELIPVFAAPILAGDADYVKGNRFFDPETLVGMPRIRILGNMALSFLAKLSTGYWNIFDPTNGFTAIHARIAERLPFSKISRSYFFETDMLFRLNSMGAVVVDMPMQAIYADEQSGLRVSRIVPEFLTKHIRNVFKRIFYRYFIRDFSMASLELLLGAALLSFGILFGVYRWYYSAAGIMPANPGAVMLAALPVLAGLQLLIAFFGHDVLSVPKNALHPSLSRWRTITKNLTSD